MSIQILSYDLYQRQAKAELFARGYSLEIIETRTPQLAMSLAHTAAQDFSSLDEDDAADFDPHAEHGDWVGPLHHICRDGEHREIEPAGLGELPYCDFCKVAYCPACDLAVIHDA